MTQPCLRPRQIRGEKGKGLGEVISPLRVAANILRSRKRRIQVCGEAQYPLETMGPMGHDHGTIDRTQVETEIQALHHRHQKRRNQHRITGQYWQRGLD